MESIWWLFIFVILIVFELLTLGLTTIWFAGGALLAFIAALCGVGLEIQIGIFVVISFVLLLAVRPFAARYVNSRTVRTNADGLVGRTAQVTEEIDNLRAKGTALLNGQTWTARSDADEIRIPAGAYVTVKAISGVKLIVVQNDSITESTVDSGENIKTEG